MYIPAFKIEPTEVVGGCIALYKNIWKDALKDIEVIEKVTSNEASPVESQFRRANVFDTNGTLFIDNQGRTNQDLFLTSAARKTEELRLINNKFFDLVCAASGDYRDRFDIHEDLFWKDEAVLLKYQTGEEYKAHYDGGTSTGRAVSPIVYLNDDYEGGELEFVNQGITIKPEAGMMAVFPANYAFRHIAHPVKDGTKYAIVTWLHDRNY